VVYEAVFFTGDKAMSGEIKLRAWDLNDLEYVCDYDTGQYSEITIYHNDSPVAFEKVLDCRCSPEGCGGCCDNWIQHTDIVLERFAGLKDKNDVAIYEGDILQHPDGKIFTVEFSLSNCGLVARYDDDLDSRLCLQIDNKGMAVKIGSIHENPELLPKGEQA
jgi:uncharacterized phage protein (TIGR01671 family)